MAIKFTKAQVAEWREHIDNIRSAHDDLTEAVQRYNDVMRAEREKVEEAIGDVAQLVAAANEWRVGVASDDLRPEWELKSDKWQDSERGTAASEWIDAVEAEVEPPEVEFPDELEEPSDDYIEEMDNLATQPKE